MQIWFIASLYALAAILPIIGIWKAIARVSLPARQYRHRELHKRNLQLQLNEKSASATTAEEREHALEWFHSERDKNDPWGTPYRITDDGFSTQSKGGDAIKRLKELTWDAVLVGGGLVLGAAASIWSLWL